jgi:hypothetical protein
MTSVISVVISAPVSIGGGAVTVGAGVSGSHADSITSAPHKQKHCAIERKQNGTDTGISGMIYLNKPDTKLISNQVSFVE